MEEYIVKETTLWGDYNARSLAKRLRYLKKQNVIIAYPWFMDHSTIYAYKPKTQRGPARDSQQFIVAYPYSYTDNLEMMEKEKEFVKLLSEIELRFYKEDCTFRGQPSHKILIIDTDVDLTAVLSLIPRPNESA